MKNFLIDRNISYHGLHERGNIENSISAIKDAVTRGYSLFLSVHQIEDGTIIVFFDEALKHKTGNDGYVNHITGKNELLDYTLEGTKEKIPTLEQALKVISGAVPVFINVRHINKAGKFEEDLLKIIKNYKGEVAVCSVNPYVLRFFAENANDIPRGLIGGKFKEDELIQTLARKNRKRIKKLKFIDTADPNFIIYQACCIKNRAVKRNRSLPLIALGVASKSEYMQCIKYCDNIIFLNFTPQI